MAFLLHFDLLMQWAKFLPRHLMYRANRFLLNTTYRERYEIGFSDSSRFLLTKPSKWLNNSKTYLL